MDSERVCGFGASLWIQSESVDSEFARGSVSKFYMW